MEKYNLKDYNYLNEKYAQLYLQYRIMYENMLKYKNYENLQNKTVNELSILMKINYPNKLRAITRVNVLFNKKINLEDLEELLDLYKYIKE